MNEQFYKELICNLVDYYNKIHSTFESLLQSNQKDLQIANKEINDLQQKTTKCISQYFGRGVINESKSKLVHLELGKLFNISFEKIFQDLKEFQQERSTLEELIKNYEESHEKKKKLNEGYEFISTSVVNIQESLQFQKNKENLEIIQSQSFQSKVSGEQAVEDNQSNAQTAKTLTKVQNNIQPEQVVTPNPQSNLTPNPPSTLQMQQNQNAATYNFSAKTEKLDFYESQTFPEGNFQCLQQQVEQKEEKKVEKQQQQQKVEQKQKEVIGEAIQEQILCQCNIPLQKFSSLIEFPFCQHKFCQDCFLMGLAQQEVKSKQRPVQQFNCFYCLKQQCTRKVLISKIYGDEEESFNDDLNGKIEMIE